MSSRIIESTLDSGLSLVVEPVDGVKSLSLSLFWPAGAASEPAPLAGLAAIVAEMTHRGAGSLDARAHSAALERLGVRYDLDAATLYGRLDASMLADRFPEALPLLISMIRAPWLEAEGLEPSRDLARQALAALDDEPTDRVFHELQARHHPPPFGRSALGSLEGIERVDLEAVRAFWRRCYVPEGAVLAVAGRVEPEACRAAVREATADWRGAGAAPEATGPPPRGAQHVPAETAQTHIGLACETVAEDHPDSELARLAVAVLSGGMSGRLFTEVRERRGLCYSVFARYAARRGVGTVMGYAGTTTERSAETLEVFAAELRRLAEGVSGEELARAKTGLKARLLMQGELSPARAGALAGDRYLLGYTRRLEDRVERIESVSLDELNAFLAAHPFEVDSMVVVGREPLSVG